MGRFRDSRREVPGLNMAAMPDLIFTVLFFFMIVTHMREVKPMVQTQVPQGTELEEARKSGVVYLLIGRPMNGQGEVLSQQPRIQLNNRLVSVGQIARAVSDERRQMPEAVRQRMVVNIRADRDVEMGLINDVKQQLRQAGALHITYTATEKSAAR